VTGAALPFEGGLTIDDVERWVDENVAVEFNTKRQGRVYVSVRPQGASE